MMNSMDLTAQDIIIERYKNQSEVWIIIPYNDIVFGKKADTVKYQISLILRDERKRQVAKHEETLQIKRLTELQNTALPVHFSTSIGAGKLDATLILKNLTLGGKRTINKKIVLGNQYTEIGFAYTIAEYQGHRFIPVSFDELSFPVNTLELVQGYSLEVDSIHVSFANVVFSPLQQTAILTDSLQIRNTISSAGLFKPAAEGSYHLDLLRYLPALKRYPLKIGFYEKNIHYWVEPFLFNQWYFYGLKYPVGDQLEQLRYFASQNEWQALSAIPRKQLPEAIENYWQKYDPSPGTLRNETREEFYSRIARADELFTIHKKIKGWKSDRGRIYIKFGPPDEISSEAFPMGSFPYIVWNYYRLDKQFYFSDSGGFGQYQLRNKEDEY